MLLLSILSHLIHVLQKYKNHVAPVTALFRSQIYVSRVSRCTASITELRTCMAFDIRSEHILNLSFDKVNQNVAMYLYDRFINEIV